MDQNNQQMNEIVGYYKELLQQAIREKGEALVQVDMANAKVSALEAERDSLQAALKNADQRIRELEFEHAADGQQMQAPVEAVPVEPAFVEPAPAEIPEAASVEPAPVEMPEVAPVEAAPEEMPEVAPVEVAPVEMPEVTPAEPAPAEAPQPDFEEQKEALRRMEAELAALEERMKKGS